MPKDTPMPSPLLDDLLELTRAAIAPAEAVLATATDRVRAAVSADGRVSGAKLEEHQSSAHALAWLATYVEALRQMQKWADGLDAAGRFGEMERLIHQIAFGEYLWQIQGGIPMSQNETAKLVDMFVEPAEIGALMTPAVMTLATKGNSAAARARQRAQRRGHARRRSAGCGARARPVA